MLNKSIVFIGLLVFSICGFSDDLVSRKSIKAKIVDIEVKKNLQGDKNTYITLEINKKVRSYAFTPFNGDSVFYKQDLSTMPINEIKIGIMYNVEVGKFTISNKKSFREGIYYIGKKPFSFEELE